MRNAFVVLVSLCIVLASGFIVPSGVLELIDNNQAILAENNGKESEETKRATLEEDTGFIVLPFRTNKENIIDLETNQNRIKDNELYEQDNSKQNNVNERSFIYINQKYKTPVVNQLYSSQDLLEDTYEPLASKVEKIKYNQFSLKFTPSFGISKPKKEYFEPKINRGDTKNTYFPPAEPYSKEISNVLPKDNKQDITPKDTPKNTPNKVSEEQREYVELLKPPLLRPILTPEKKKDSRLWESPDKSLSNYQPLKNNMYIPSLPVDPRQFAMKSYDNYGFPTPYGYQRSIPQFSFKPEEAFKPEELGMVTDSSVKNVLIGNNNVDVTKLLNRYLEQTLEEQVTNERINAKNNDCTYSNCALKSAKQYLHSRTSGDTSQCKCGRRLNFYKQRQSSGFNEKETNKIIDKEQRSSTENNVTPMSSESDYGEMLADEMNLKKLLDD